MKVNVDKSCVPNKTKTVLHVLILTAGRSKI